MSWFSMSGAIMSSDGQYMVKLDDDLVILKRSGWECRYSRFGMLGMPHVWGMIVAMGAAAWAMVREGRGKGETATGGWVAGGTAAIGCAMTIYLILTLCAGQPASWAWGGPAVWVAGVGAAAGGKFWRFGAIAVLGAVLLLAGWKVRGVMDYSTPGKRWVLDRMYTVPRGVLIGVPATAAGWMAVGIAMLAKGTRRMSY